MVFFLVVALDKIVWWIINKKMWGAKLKFKIIKKKVERPVPHLFSQEKNKYSL